MAILSACRRAQIVLGIMSAAWLAGCGSPAPEDPAPVGSGPPAPSAGSTEEPEQPANRPVGEGSLEQAKALEARILASWQSGQKVEDEILEMAEEALAIRERLLPPGDPDLVPALGILCRLYDWTSPPRHDEARRMCERHVEIRRRQGPPGPPLGDALQALANHHILLHEASEARGLYEEALAIQEEHAPGSGEVARVRYNLANCFMLLRELEEARIHIDRALEIWGDAPRAAQALNLRAGLLQLIGEHREARRDFERALQVPGLDPVSESFIRNGLGLVLVDLRNYSDAGREYDASLQIMRENGVSGEYVATVVSNRAHARHLMGDLDGARALYEEAKKILEEPGQRRAVLATTLEEFGDLLAEMGELERAESHYRLAGGIWSEDLPPADPHHAVPLSGRADLRLRRGDAPGAVALYRQALSIREGAYGPTHREVGRTLHDIAHALAAGGAGIEAAEAALRSVEILREHLQWTIPGLAEREALRYAGVGTASLDLAIGLATRHDDLVERVWDAQVRSRALVLDEMAERRRLSSVASEPEVRRRREALARMIRRCSRLVIRGPQPGDAEAFPDQVAACRAELEAAERGLAGASVEYARRRARRQSGLAEVRGALPEGAALVGYRRYEVRGEPGEQFAAFVLPSRDAPSLVVPLGPAAEIQARISRWARQASLRTKAGYRAAGEDLRRAIWDPVEPHLGGARQVFLVPDGGVALVAFASLPVGESAYLVEAGPGIHYLSAERDLVEPPPAPSGPPRLLAVGGVDFGPPGDPLASSSGEAGSGADCGSLGTQGFDPLPASLHEAEDVAAIWQEDGISRAEILRGAEPEEATVKARAPGSTVLHLATHGFFVQDDCASFLEGTRFLSLRPASGPPLPEGTNPLLLSGLVLAGANRRNRAKPDEEDGMLTAAEVAAMDLRGVRWAVLSACDTAKGEIAVGEGVLGLRRAFRVAGAATVIMSLWSVGDEPTREWMVELYRARGKGMETAGAVRQASLSVLQRRREDGRSTHPFYWAGFIASGDWR